MTTYEVFYNIQVNSQIARENILRFASAIRTVKHPLEQLTAAANNLQAAMNACKSATVTINTNEALDRLNQLARVIARTHVDSVGHKSNKLSYSGAPLK